MFKGLSLEQAPPISAPLRFFLTAPLFAIIAGFSLFYIDASLLTSRYTNEVMGLVHLYTLGFFTMVMIGAMQQMLPVLVGVTFPRPALFATIIHVALIIGTLLLSYGFITSQMTYLLYATFFLLLAIGLFIAVVLWKILFLKFANDTVYAMRFAMVVLLGVLGLGLHLSASLSFSPDALFLKLVDTHALLAVFGWVGLLIVGVTFQLIPMFYVTPEFNKQFKRYFPLVLVLAVLLSIIGVFKELPLYVIVLVMFMLFSLYTLYMLKQRKRKLSDITIMYWKLASISFVLGALVVISNLFFQSEQILIIGSTMIGYGFILSLITGMLYKIVPFLVWFHISSMGHFDMPTMRELIPMKDAKRQYYLHIASFLALLLIPYIPAFVAGGLMVLSNSYLLFNLIRASRVYNQYVNKPNPMGDMSQWT